MLKKPLITAFSLIAILHLLAITSFSQQSWIWSRDDNSREINLDTDSISLVLLESRVPSGDNFIAKDTQVGLLIDSKFQGTTAAEPVANRDFPFMFLATTEAMSDPEHKKSKILAEQRLLVTYFPLSDGDIKYRGISINMSLLRKQDKKVWVKVLDTLLSATNNLSLPSPLSVGITYLNKFSTDVLQQHLPDPNKQKRIDLGTLSFLVSNTSGELNRIVKSGLHLRLLQPTSTGPGWVNPSDWDRYCFYTKFDASNWMVQVAPKDPTAPDKDQEGCSKSKYTRLMNDYVPILIQVQITKPLGPDLISKLSQLESINESEASARLKKRAADLKSAADAQCKAYRGKNC